LHDLGWYVNEGKIVDAGFVEVPKQRNSKEENKQIKSKVRCLCEHVFGFVTNSKNDFYIKSIGLIRAKGSIGLINLLYYMCRYEQIVRLNLLEIKK
jgi:hypothetical protein